MTVGYIIDKFLHELEKAKEAEYINKPYSWALYQTWKWCNFQEANRHAHLVLNEDNKTFRIEENKDGSN